MTRLGLVIGTQTPSCDAGVGCDGLRLILGFGRTRLVRGGGAYCTLAGLASPDHRVAQAARPTSDDYDEVTLATCCCRPRNYINTEAAGVFSMAV